MSEFICKKCGKPSETYLHLLDCPNDEHGAIMRDKGYCWHCAFWQPLVEAKNNPLAVRVNGRHYWIEEEETAFKGFGGAEFKIHFTDGRKKADVTTTNLWCQGDIPEHFKADLPNNAEFVR